MGGSCTPTVHCNPSTSHTIRSDFLLRKFWDVLGYLPEILPCETKILVYDPQRHAISGLALAPYLGVRWRPRAGNNASSRILNYRQSLSWTNFCRQTLSSLYPQTLSAIFSYFAVDKVCIQQNLSWWCLLTKFVCMFGQGLSAFLAEFSAAKVCLPRFCRV